MSDTATTPSNAETVTVRMYRGLLGDCFLLTHARGKARADRFHALIDCGALQAMGDRDKKQATVKGLQRLEEAVDDIAAYTGGVLDLVIATHEHYDHLSGFLTKFETFQPMTIRKVWLAWTESRTDGLANDIRARGKKALSLLTTVAKDGQSMALDAQGKARIRAVQDVLQFFDEEIEPWTPGGMLGAAAKPKPPFNPAENKPKSCANVIEWLRFKAGETNVRYLEPGQVVTFGLNDALRASVLGPPRGGAFLRQLDPKNGEVYLTSRDEVDTLETTLRAKRMGMAGAAETTQARPDVADQPFSLPYRRVEADDPTCKVIQLYRDEPQRRIDGEWLGSAEQLALKIDGDVNNTSLALAIEVPGPARHVLLFPADAQVGNWLSWHAQDYSEDAKDPTKRSETATQILSRVVLYKVGHHGSHNATVREKGLELMTSPHLCAMIPVVKDIAGEQGSGWKMPYDHLFERLKEKTAERIVQGDGVVADETRAFATSSLFKPKYAPGDDPLWVDLKMKVAR